MRDKMESGDKVHMSLSCALCGEAVIAGEEHTCNPEKAESEDSDATDKKSQEA